jgi:putative ABC transport system permease protein
MAWHHRLLRTLRPGRLERDLDRELSFHLAERIDQLKQHGLNEAEAVRMARAQFGNLTLQRERSRDLNVTGSLDALLRSVRHAWRAIVRTPGFAVTVVLTLALGIGANAAVFSLIDAVLLRPLPFPDADRLVRLTQIREASGESNTAAVRLDEWSRGSSTFVGIVAYQIEDVSDTTGTTPQRVRRATVGPRFLEVVGLNPRLGRGFAEGEHRLGGPAAALISERYWRARYSADPGVLGQAIRMGNRSYPVVGVLPASFGFPDDDVDWWVPQWIDAPWALPRTYAYPGVGRLKPGVTLEQARADLERVQARLADEYPKTDRDLRPHVTALKDVVVGGVRGSLWILFASVVVLLLIACTNIAALLLTRSARRQQEVAVRYALGASRRAVALHFLSESTVLAVAGALAGLVVALGLLAGFRALAPALPRLDEVALDERVLVYTAVATAIVAALCGLVPALRSTRMSQLRSDSDRTQVSRRQTMQWLLVGLQVTFSVTLLVIAALFVRSLDALTSVDLGFDSSRVLTFRISGSFGDEPDYGRTVQRIKRTLDELAELPGIEATATTTILPGLPDSSLVTGFTIVEQRGDGSEQIAQLRVVSPSYFHAMQMPLLEGELCREGAGVTGVIEAMVNRSFASRFVRDRSAVGLHLAGGTPDRIAGIVGDAREVGVDRDPVPMIYQCFSAATPIPWYLVRTRGESAGMIDAIRSKVRQLEPLRSVYDTRPLDARIDDAYTQNRLRTIVLVLFAVTAVALACLGVYGTLAYAISLRRREVGLRVALGASRLGIVGQFLYQGVRVVVAASVAGLLLSIALARTLSGMLYEISPTDPATLSAVVLLVVAVGSIAALVPAARAALTEPAQVLRGE